jgi:hypothetical protein
MERSAGSAEERGLSKIVKEKRTRLLGVSMDITERKQAEQLFTSQLRLHLTGTVLVDHEGASCW